MARGIEGKVDSQFPAYFIFGEASSGLVDVADVNGNVVTGISRVQAERLVADREALRQALIQALGEG